MTNRFGLDTDYFEEKLSITLRDIDNYTPEEMARALTRLGITADGEAAASCTPKLPMGWYLERMTGLIMIKNVDGSQCVGAIEDTDSIREHILYNLLNDLMGDDDG